MNMSIMSSFASWFQKMSFFDERQWEIPHPKSFKKWRYQCSWLFGPWSQTKKTMLWNKVCLLFACSFITKVPIYIHFLNELEIFDFSAINFQIIEILDLMVQKIQIRDSQVVGRLISQNRSKINHYCCYHNWNPTENIVFRYWDIHPKIYTITYQTLQGWGRLLVTVWHYKHLRGLRAPIMGPPNCFWVTWRGHWESSEHRLAIWLPGWPFNCKDPPPHMARASEVAPKRRLRWPYKS